MHAARLHEVPDFRHGKGHGGVRENGWPQHRAGVRMDAAGDVRRHHLRLRAVDALRRRGGLSRHDAPESRAVHRVHDDAVRVQRDIPAFVKVPERAPQAGKPLFHFRAVPGQLPPLPHQHHPHVKPHAKEFRGGAHAVPAVVAVAAENQGAFPAPRKLCRLLRQRL